MTRERAGLPDRRGYRTGPDAYVNQVEADLNAASKQIPSWEPAVVLLGTGAGANLAPTANLLYLFAYSNIDQIIEADSVRAFVTAPPVAGSWIETAVFIFDKQSDTFMMIPGTSARIPTGAANRAAAPLRETIPLRPTNDLMLVGLRIWGGGGAVTLAGLGQESQIVSKEWTYPLLSTDPIPGSVKRSLCTTVSVVVPLVAYVSKAWSGIV